MVHCKRTTDLERMRDVTLRVDNDGLSATCDICGGRRRWRTEEVNLADIIDAMNDHISRNHPRGD